MARGAFRRLWRLIEATTAAPAPAVILVSEDLETAEFMLRTENGQELPVHVSVEALAGPREARVRTCEDATLLVRDRLPALERAARGALERGDLHEGVILLRPEDLSS